MRSILINKFCLSSSDRPPRSVSKSAMSIGGAEFFDAWMCLFLLVKNQCSQVSKNLALFTSWIYVLKFAFQKMKEKSTYVPVRARVYTCAYGPLNNLYGLLSNPSAAILPPYTQMAKNGSIFGLCEKLN